jgi:hypothetical protein
LTKSSDNSWAITPPRRRIPHLHLVVDGKAREDRKQRAVATLASARRAKALAAHVIAGR